MPPPALRALLAASLLTLSLAAARAAAPLVHTITMLGHVAGEERLVPVAGGGWHVDYRYVDNGRGPEIHEDFALAADGSLRRYVATGVSSYGAPIAERFERDARGVHWQSLAEAQRVDVAPQAGARVYAPIEPSDHLTAQAARLLLRHPGQPLPCWTGGQLSARRLVSLRVGPAARPVVVDLVAVEGLALQPSYLWLRHGGEQALFAVVQPGFEVVEKGYEGTAGALFAAQQRADGALRRALAERLAHHVGDDLLIRDVRVFDAEHATLGPAADVYVSRGRIAAIRPAGSTAEGEFAVVDGAGRTLLPGLFDMHVHDEAWSGLLHLAGGVTTGRDMGNDNDFLRALMDDIDAGRVLGERIVPAGYIEGESPFASRSGFVVDSVPEALRAVEWYAERGYPQVKLYNSIHPEWVVPIAERAHALGLRVSGHVPAFMRAEEAVRAGYDEIQHINMVMLNFLVGPGDDTRTLLRFDRVAEKAAGIDLDGPAVRDFIALLKARGTVVDPTVATFEASLVQLQGEANPSHAADARHLPPVVRRGLRVNSSNVTPANVERYRASFAALLGMIGRLHAAGVPLVAGTDDMPGFMLHRELELYVQAGIPAAQALKIATWNGALYTRTLDRLGSITPGKLADLVLVDGDPTARIADIRRIAMVVKEGVIYFPAELHAAIGVEPFVPAPTISHPRNAGAR